MLLRPRTKYVQLGGGQRLQELLPWRPRRDPLLVCSIHHCKHGAALASSLPLHLLRHLRGCLQIHSGRPAKVNRHQNEMCIVSTISVCLHMRQQLLLMLRMSLTIGLIGRMTVNGAYFICLQYSSEIFPTVIRGQGVGLVLQKSPSSKSNSPTSGWIWTWTLRSYTKVFHKL